MVVTKRWRGMRWTQAVPKTNGTDADGKAVWSWRPTLASSLRGVNPQATVANKPDHRGERGISRKPLCGDAGVPPLSLWMLMRFFFLCV